MKKLFTLTTFMIGSLSATANYTGMDLINAVKSGKLELVKTIIKSTSSDRIDSVINYKVDGTDQKLNDENDETGMTALMYAIYLSMDNNGNPVQNQQNIAKELINAYRKYNLNINITSKYNVTALINAAYVGNISIVNMLLDVPTIKLNIKDTTSGFSALMYAVDRDNKDIVTSLLKNGASKTLTSLDGDTALTLAQDKLNKLSQKIRTTKDIITLLK